MVNKEFNDELKNMRKTISNLIKNNVHFKDILGSLIESELEFEDDLALLK